jgi:CNT family concentrative nucleoside transporter
MNSDNLEPAAKTLAALPPTPLSWRLAIALGISLLAGAAYLLQSTIGLRGQAIAGVFFFFGLVAIFSTNLRAVNWQTIGWGFALQLALAWLVLKVEWVERGFQRVGDVVKQFINFSDKGAEFVFGNLARPGDIALKPGAEFLFMFAFKALPPILFVSAFFTVLYHFGILQWCVRLMARVMVYLLRTSGAETLSVSANVFMGQTEAPLIVKPYVPRMTNSELFTLMVSGMAHISGGMMVVYINYGADPVAVLTTCVMACPCSLYLAKLFLPETGTPETAGTVHMHSEKSPYVNAIDAATAGTTVGLQLALNVAAMLIVFVAFVALFDGLLASIKPGLLWLGIAPDALAGWPDNLSLRTIFGWLFSPAAFLMGVSADDAHQVGSLLGAKLAINEHFAYLEMKKLLAHVDPATQTAVAAQMGERSFRLTAFALTGFANFASVGIQLGGIGAIAPERRHDLARLGGRALFVGFTATLLNAAIAGVLLPPVFSSPQVKDGEKTASLPGPLKTPVVSVAFGGEAHASEGHGLLGIAGRWCPAGPGEDFHGRAGDRPSQAGTWARREIAAKKALPVGGTLGFCNCNGQEWGETSIIGGQTLENRRRDFLHEADNDHDQSNMEERPDRSG